MTDDFIMTIESGDDETPVLSTSRQSRGKRKTPEDETVALDPSFSFDLTGDAYVDVFHTEVTFQDVVKS
jgi:ATP-dependent RNA helicase DDX27